MTLMCFIITSTMIMLLKQSHLIHGEGHEIMVPLSCKPCQKSHVKSWHKYDFNIS